MPLILLFPSPSHPTPPPPPPACSNSSLPTIDWSFLLLLTMAGLVQLGGVFLAASSFTRFLYKARFVLSSSSSCGEGWVGQVKTRVNGKRGGGPSHPCTRLHIHIHTHTHTNDTDDNPPSPPPPHTSTFKTAAERKKKARETHA